MRKILISLSAVLLLAIAAPGESAIGPNSPVLRVRDGRSITFSEMIAEVKKADVVFVGEVHDDSEHHEAELDVIRSLHETDTPMAIGLEMFRADSQRVLDSWVRERLPVEDFLPVYFDNWQLPWSFYNKIFWYAREHEIPLVGLNIPDAIAKKVARQGFTSLTKAERKQLPTGISCNVDEKYMEFIRQAYAGHGGHGRAFVNFCEAQMVWDKSMAWHVIRYRKDHPDRKVVVLAGVGHAWKRGMPEQLALDSHLNYRVILPLIPGQIEKKTVTTRDADYVLLE